MVNTVSGNTKLLRIVPFSEVSFWDYKRFSTIDINSKYPLELLRNHIEERNDKIKPFESPDKIFKILGVNNKVGVFDSYDEYGKNINQPYKRVEDSDLAYNPYRVNVGSIGLKTENQKNQYISPAYVVFSCKENLNAEFFYRLFKTDTFNRIVNENTTGSVRQNLKFDILQSIKIPLPPLSEQNKLVEAYNKRIALASKQEEKAAQLEKEIENYLFKELGLTKSKEIHKSKTLTFKQFKNISIWGADRILRGGDSSILYSDKYENKKLSLLAQINPRTDLSNLKEEDNMSFIPMACVSDDYGEVMELRGGKKSESKGYTKFQDGDLIWARITPCMQNGKSAIVQNLKNGLGYGSTEYHIVRKLSNEFSIEYTYTLLRTSLVRNDAVNYFTGSAGQQRVPKSYLEELEVPVPPLSVQNRIVNKINELKDQVKTLNNEALINRREAIKEFEKEIFS